MIGLTKSLALEFGPKGITVNTIPPGLHRHADAPRLRGQGPARRGRRAPREAHAGAPGRPPEDIAATCSFLVRDEASYITGQVIGVNGGRNTG